MCNASKSIPRWLSLSQSPSHIRYALQTLSEREDIRESARSYSRYPTDPSGRSRRHTRSFSQYIGHSEIDQIHIDYYSVAVGCLPENLLRNRYRNIEPYNRTRVGVGHGESSRRESDNEGRYLNANWVLERAGGKWWIASQAPLPSTAHTFLSLVLQPNTRPPVFLQPLTPLAEKQSCRVRTIVQLTMEVEDGHRKADSYFPSKVGQSFVIPPEAGHLAPALKVTLVESQAIDEASCIESTVSITPLSLSEDHNNEGIGDPITIRHILYTKWPDHGVPEPEDHASLLAFLRFVDHANKDVSFFSYSDGSEPHPDPPIIVNCSAGIGRTGSFIALSSLLRAHGFLDPPPSPASALPATLPVPPLQPLPGALQDDPVVQEVDSLREQRPGMVQREEQIRLIYKVLASAFLEQAQSWRAI